MTALKAAGVGDKLPDLAKLREEYSRLSEEKDRLYAEYGSLKKRMREYDAVKQNIDSILSAADAVMVARGDLGVEIDFTELPGIQKNIIERSFSFGKPIVTATQMLDSMCTRAVPTRAEVSDIYNAVLDGASSLMLTGETAAGQYPVQAMEYLVRTARTAM